MPDETSHETTDAAPKESRDLTTWEGFRAELQDREEEIGSMLPSNVSRDRFINSAVAAVKQTPGLLEATPRSLFAAITKSAQDGLLPDGREGVITIYNEKQKKGGRDVWVKAAQWNPMTFGLRKRAREIDGIIVNAQVVHENDDFTWVEGDEPHIEHKPAQLGQPRGEMIGCYAIIKREGGPILHREVMDKDQVAAVREQSKAQNSLLWTKFVSEGWRKAVVRRAFKSVPCSASLQNIVQRDDDMFAFDEQPMRDVTPPPPKRGDYISSADVQAQAAGDTQGAKEGDEIDAVAAQEGEAGYALPYILTDAYGEEVGPFTDPDEFAAHLINHIEGCGNPAQLQALREHNEDAIAALGPTRESPAAQRIWTAYNAARSELSPHQQEDGDTPAGSDAAEPGAGAETLV